MKSNFDEREEKFRLRDEFTVTREIIRFQPFSAFVEKILSHPRVILVRNRDCFVSSEREILTFDVRRIEFRISHLEDKGRERGDIEPKETDKADKNIRQR